MMKRILCSLIAVGVTFLHPYVYAQRSHVLDLTTVPKPEPESSDGTVTYGHGYASANVRLPIELTLVSTDQTVYAPRSPIVFEVAAKNVGTVPLAMPWVPWGIDKALMHLAETQDQPVLDALITLEAMGSGADHRTISMTSVRLQGIAAGLGRSKFWRRAKPQRFAFLLPYGSLQASTRTSSAIPTAQRQ